MVTTATKVDWVVVANEVEALVLEYSWIKEYTPRFNVRFRDDKSYPYLAITMSDQFPRVAVVREAKRKGTRYFGPYAQAWAVRATLDELVKVFPVRTCREGVFRQAKNVGRPCLLGYIDRCSAPCVGRVTPEEYSDLVSQLTRFLSGQSKEFVHAITERMTLAAQNQEYEAAAKWRDRLAALESVMERNTVVFDDDADADVIALVSDELLLGVQVFHVRMGRVTGERFFVIEKLEDLSEAGYAERAITRLYSESGSETIPKEVLVSVMPEESKALSHWLQQLRGSMVGLRVPQRGDKRSFMQTAMVNSEKALAKYRLERNSDITVRTKALNELQSVLDLPEPPLRIECIDISTLQGEDTVASLVVFEDGLPKKSEYRKFIIKGDRKDDLASVAEVVTRRFRRTQTEEMENTEIRGKFAYPPSLLVIDGAYGQVQAAATAAREAHINVTIIGLAKRLEEVWIEGDSDPLILPRNSPALHLLQRVRDESHRVAIGFHRKKRGARRLESELDAVPGLGPSRIAALRKHFGSLKAVKSASVTDIAAVKGIGPNLAHLIKEALPDHASSDEVLPADTAPPSS